VFLYLIVIVEGLLLKTWVEAAVLAAFGSARKAGF
jgi:hypothetical protein